MCLCMCVLVLMCVGVHVCVFELLALFLAKRVCSYRGVLAVKLACKSTSVRSYFHECVPMRACVCMHMGVHACMCSCIRVFVCMHE